MTNTSVVKRRDAEKTKSRIMSAAFDLFAEQGYAKTGTREIASLAGVAQSLIRRHFGTKANLFEQALIHAIHTNSIFVESRKNFGREMARQVVSKSNPKLTAMVVLAIADPQSKEIAQRVSLKHIVTPLAMWLGPPNARARALNMLTLLNGFTIQFRHLSAEKVPAASVKWLGSALQTIVDNKA